MTLWIYSRICYDAIKIYYIVGHWSTQDAKSVPLQLDIEPQIVKQFTHAG